MAFKIRDLMITVLPPGIQFGGLVAEPCDGGSEVPPGPPPGPDPGPDVGGVQFINPEVLVELRVFLQLALTQLGGPLAQAELRPQTLREVDLLEKSLVGALEEVRALRTRFAPGKSGG
jgi:hypothetical protein